MKWFPIVVFSTLLISSGCKKEKEKIDLYSMPSINKVTCKINGKNWQATEIITGFSIRTFDNYQYYHLNAYNKNTLESIEIYLNTPYSVLQRHFNQNTLSYYYTAYPKDYGFFDRYLGLGNSETYITNEIDTGYCTITYMDSVNLRIKGIFAFKARDEYTNQTITITDGYFERVQ
jgi:hypothetical protein